MLARERACRRRFRAACLWGRGQSCPREENSKEIDASPHRSQRAIETVRGTSLQGLKNGRPAVQKRRAQSREPAHGLGITGGVSRGPTSPSGMRLAGRGPAIPRRPASTDNRGHCFALCAAPPFPRSELPYGRYETTSRDLSRLPAMGLANLLEKFSRLRLHYETTGMNGFFGSFVNALENHAPVPRCGAAYCAVSLGRKLLPIQACSPGRINWCRRRRGGGAGSVQKWRWTKCPRVAVAEVTSATNGAL